MTNISEAYQNLLINAIKLYYEQVEGQPRQYYEIPRPKRPLPNPKLLGKDEVKALLLHTESSKHYCMLMLAYGLGLRLSEVLNLTLQDIHSSRMVLYVRGGKGKKTVCCLYLNNHYIGYATTTVNTGHLHSCLKASRLVSPTAPGP